MKPREDVKIAGARTVAEWLATRAKLTGSHDPDAWKRAHTDFFVERLRRRYFDPIDILRKPKAHRKNGQEPWLGEGFAIVALQCSLIEFLGATLKGQTYVHKSELKHRKDRRKTEHEYTESGDMFVWFLRTAPPFKDIFGGDDEVWEFYRDVRCGLLHEARTRGHWTISSREALGPCIDVKAKIIYRNDLQDAFKTFTAWYGSELAKNKDYQEAFIRKFDNLCAA